MKKHLSDTENLERSSKKRRLTSAQLLFIGVSAIILIGSGLLMLPWATYSGISYADAFFTSASAVSITGIMLFDTATTFTVFGQVVLLLLIQAGGLGFMTLATLIFVLIRKQITLSERVALSDSIESDPRQGLARYAKSIFLITFIIEGVGFFLFLPFFVINFGGIGVWKALFTSVSAYCNSGIDVFGTAGASMTGFASGAYYGGVMVLLTTSFLVVTGGLGVAVLTDVFKARRWSKFRFHTKLVLIATGALLAFGTVLYLAFEYNNPETLGGMGFGHSLLNAWFLSVTPRTAGFLNVDISALSPPSLLLTTVYMFIGAAPASTGGGIKVTTLAILILTVYAGIKNKKDVTAGKRQLTVRAIYRSVAVFLFALILIITVSMILLLTEKEALTAAGLYSLEKILFEVTSAFSTTGITVGVTANATLAGRLIIAFVMICGRLGPITIGLIFIRRLDREKSLVKYAEGNVMIG